MYNIQHSITREDVKMVEDILQSPCLTQGPAINQFEIDVKNYCGSKYSLAVNSATSALHISCLALGLGPNDWLWTTPITFVASANCAIYCGANVDFVDIDPKTYNICTEKLELKLKLAKSQNKLPKVLVPVNLCGQSCDLERIHKLSLEYDFKIIEDAAHSIGGSYKNEKIGNCRFSHITVFSFHPVKIITTGEGGMAMTNDSEIYKRLKLYRSHGITNETKYFHYKPSQEEVFNYQQIDIGYNYRMTDIHAALGISQLKRIDEFVLKRHEIANKYYNELKNTSVTLPFQHKDTYSSFHLFPIRIKSEDSNRSKKKIYDELIKRGIGVNLHYIPIYKHPFYQKLGFHYSYCQEAEFYYKEAISLPIFPSLSEDAQSKVIENLKILLN